MEVGLGHANVQLERLAAGRDQNQGLIGAHKQL